MKKTFYPKLAFTGIRKNKKLYMPYILTCICMVMMYYIVHYLHCADFLSTIPSHDTLSAILYLGSWVIAIFSLVFLFYTNSFLVRRRKMEFGLYNILGMGKRNIGIIMFWETIITASISLVIGLIFGALFSKLAELVLVKMMNGKVTYELSVSFNSMLMAVAVFGIIFFLIFLNSLRQVHTANPISLLRSENIGEKPPKANLIFGLLGVIILGIAYYMAVSIKQPLTAFTWFFVAVILVIIGTYIIFISSSVVLCRFLKKKKNYYYKANHFVSVSSMSYRMKRNGAGLASICILATMVLVILSSTSCLYFGEEDILSSRYPRDINITTRFNSCEAMNEDTISQLRNIVKEKAGKHINNYFEVRQATIAGILQNGRIEPDNSMVNFLDSTDFDNILNVTIIPLEDYNLSMGTSEKLENDEAIIYSYRSEYPYKTIQIDDGTVYKVKKGKDKLIFDGELAVDVVDSVTIIIPNYISETTKLETLVDINGKALIPEWLCMFDVDTDDDEQIAIMNEIHNEFTKSQSMGNHGIVLNTYNSLAENRGDFYSSFGGLFFIGIILSIVFIFATVLIIYYKQISEGYEDRSRFEIMQKVGMSKKIIKKSINSQMLTIFFLPIIFAVLHFVFAFPLISKLLMLFAMTNTKLLILISGISILAFALLYALVYRITANAYYSIVSNKK